MQAIEQKCDFCKKANGIIICPDGIDAVTMKKILYELAITIQCEDCSYVSKKKKRDEEAEAVKADKIIKQQN